MSKKKHRRKKTNRGMIVFLIIALALIGLIVFLVMRVIGGSADGTKSPKATVEPTAEATITPEPTAEPTSTPTPMPTPIPTPGLGEWEVTDVVAEAQPKDNEKLKIDTRIYIGDTLLEEGEYRSEDEIFFDTSDKYTELEGITTFRGNNYRDNAAYGSIGSMPKSMSIKWSVRIKELDEWSGVGWTGQSSIVRWDEATKQIMNIYPDKKAKAGLTEVIYATLDGHIYFLDLEDGTPTRDPIDIGAPIKGSLTIDPRGYPLLYCGQGIDEVHGRDVPIGTRVFSLIDSSVLLFIDGRDPKAIRHWYASDCSPMIDAETDTMIQLGENAITYIVKLNTEYDPEAGTIAIHPEITRYLFKTNVSSRPGMENSLAIYNHYAYFGDNSGFIQCLDLNTLQPAWIGYTGDDIDSTMVLEVEDSGQVALYTANELDLRGNSGNCQMRKYDALTGEELWKAEIRCKTENDVNGGAFATPALGKGTLRDLVYFNIARTEDGGTLLALDKATGEVVWKRGLKKYSWSSPTCVYDDEGNGYIMIGNAAGYLKMLNGLTGELICEVDAGSNMEASPTIFNDMLVIGTRGCRILGIQFK